MPDRFPNRTFAARIACAMGLSSDDIERAYALTDAKYASWSSKRWVAFMGGK